MNGNRASGNITLSATGTDYTFDSNNGGQLTLSVGSGTPTINVVASNRTLTIPVNNGIAGTQGIAKTGAGTLILAAASTYTGGTTLSAGTIQIANTAALGSTSNALTVNGGTLDLNGISISVGNLTGTGGTITSTSTTNRTLTIGTGNGTGGNYQGIIQNGNGTTALTKVGTGTIALSGANTYTGATTINAGTLQIGNGTTTGSLSTSSAITTNGTIAFNRSNTVTQGTDFNSVIGGTGGVSQVGTGTLILNGNNTFSGTVAVTQGTLQVATLNNAGTNGVLGAGTSAVVLGSAGGNTGTLNYTGSTTTSNRSFSAVSGGKAAFTVGSGTTLTLSSVVGGEGQKIFGGSGNYVLTGGVQGNGTLFKTGTGALTLTAVGHSGATEIQQGRVNLNQNNVMDNATSLSFSSGVELDNTHTGPVSLNNDTMAISIGSSLTFIGTQNLDMGDGTVTLGGNTTFTVNMGTLTFGGNVLGSGYGITKNGAGVLRLTGLSAASSFNGNSVVNAGELFLDGTSSLRGTGSNTITLNSGGTLRTGPTGSTGNVTVVLNGGTLIATTVQNSDQVFAVDTTMSSNNGQFNGVQTINTGIVVSGDEDWLGTIPASPTPGRIVMQSGSELRSTLGIDINVNKGISLAGGTVTFSTNNDADHFIHVHSVIAGNGTLSKTGPGELFLINTASTYSGGTVVRDGDLHIWADGSLGAVSGRLLLDGGELTTGLGQTVTLNASRVVQLANGKTSTLAANDGTTLTYNGVIDEEVGAGAAANLQIGSSVHEGTVILGGANSYNGTTTVAAGRLLVNNTTGSGTGSGDVIVNSGATFGGSGSIAGSLTVLSGGTLAPGSSIESLSAGNTTWNGGMTFEFEFDTDGTGTAGNNWDLLTVTGSLDLTGASSLNQIIFDLYTMSNTTTRGLLASWDPDMNHTWAGFVTTTGGVTGFASDKFNIVTTGFQNSIAPEGSFSVVHNGNNLDLVYVAVPEPPMIALAAAAGVAGLVIRRRRRPA